MLWQCLGAPDIGWDLIWSYVYNPSSTCYLTAYCSKASKSKFFKYHEGNRQQSFPKALDKNPKKLSRSPYCKLLLELESVILDEFFVCLAENKLTRLKYKKANVQCLKGKRETIPFLKSFSLIIKAEKLLVFSHALMRKL